MGKTHVATIVWHHASTLPDADIEILIGKADGETVHGYYDDEQGEFMTTYGLPVEANCWADIPEQPSFAAHPV